MQNDSFTYVLKLIIVRTPALKYRSCLKLIDGTYRYVNCHSTVRGWRAEMLLSSFNVSDGRVVLSDPDTRYASHTFWNNDFSRAISGVALLLGFSTGAGQCEKRRTWKAAPPLLPFCVACKRQTSKFKQKFGSDKPKRRQLVSAKVDISLGNGATMGMSGSSAEDVLSEADSVAR